MVLEHFEGSPCGILPIPFSADNTPEQTPANQQQRPKQNEIASPNTINLKERKNDEKKK